MGFVDGFPVGHDPKAGTAWLAHCYGTLGAGRGNDEDSSIGAELYVVDGQSPRQLDDNITVVGRIVQGMELLSVIPRGPAPMGFYEKPGLRTTIKSIELASELPEAECVPLQLLRSDSKAFIEATEGLRRTRKTEFVIPAKAGTQCLWLLHDPSRWIPAFAGTTIEDFTRSACALPR